MTPTPTRRQLSYLKALADRTGQTFTYPRTRQRASAEINRLTHTPSSTRTERRVERKPIADAIATGPLDSNRVRDDELAGYGSTATWAHHHDPEPADPAPSTPRRMTPHVGPRTELARYTVPAGERVIYGQPVDGIVRVTDRPAAAGGRAYLIERGLETKPELDALVTDYLATAQRLQVVPMSESPADRLLGHDATRDERPGSRRDKRLQLDGLGPNPGAQVGMIAGCAAVVPARSGYARSVAPPEPMLSITAGRWPAGGDWVLQPKWDGIRLLIEVGVDHRARAWSRHGIGLTGRLGELTAAFADTPDRSIFDGELVAIAERDGHPVQDFATVGRAVLRGDITAAEHLRFVAFDALAVDHGRSVISGSPRHCRPANQDRNGHWHGVCDVGGRRVVALAGASSADHVGELVSLVYSRIDADGDLREVRLAARIGASAAA